MLKDFFDVQTGKYILSVDVVKMALILTRVMTYLNFDSGNSLNKVGNFGCIFSKHISFTYFKRSSYV